MAGFHAALISGAYTAPPPTPTYNKVRMYRSPGGNTAFVLRGDKAGVMTTPSSTGSVGTLPAGWRQGSAYGSPRPQVGIYDTPFILNGVVVPFDTVRQTITAKFVATASLFDLAYNSHVVIAARHKGLPYSGYGDNRSDALLTGAIGAVDGLPARANLLTIEAIEGKPASTPGTVWPISYGQEYYSMSGGPMVAWGVVLESLQYGTTNPTARIRLYNDQGYLWYDSGPVQYTGTPFTAANASVIVSCVDMGGTNTPYLALANITSFMTPRDTEVPQSVLLDEIFGA